MENYRLRYHVEEQEKWRDFVEQMPYLSFPADWKVSIIPPFGGALARFRVKLPSGLEKSIYFDAYEKLGSYGEPYWEVYSYRGDTGRCALNEIDKLIEMIGDESGEDI